MPSANTVESVLSVYHSEFCEAEDMGNVEALDAMHANLRFVAAMVGIKPYLVEDWCLVQKHFLAAGL